MTQPDKKASSIASSNGEEGIYKLAHMVEMTRDNPLVKRDGSSGHRPTT